MDAVRGWSISLGRYFGVEVRLHALFVMLLPAIVLVSGAISGAAFRGIGLWLLLLVAVLVRETGRGLAYAAAGHPINKLVLLPTGAAPQDEPAPQLAPGTERLLALAGPLSNFFAGITMALLMYSATSQINLFERPWFGPHHLLRSAIWAQVLLGGLNLLPAFPLDAGLILRRQFYTMRGAVAGARAAAGIGQAIATILVLVGAAMQNSWLIIMGCSVLLSSRGEAQSALASSVADSVSVAEVMQTEFSTLSSSDTLEDALRRSVHSLQEVFPVVRGPVIVGSISRETLLTALRTGGNGYVQSAMTRTLETAGADDMLLPLLRQAGGRTGAQLIPVLRDDRVVGILTASNLSRSMGLLGRTRRALLLAGQAGRNG